MRTTEAVYANLREFVERLRHDGELREISVRVDPRLEIAEIADRSVKSNDGGPALLFTDVKDSQFPVLINALATERRMSRALDVDTLQELESKVGALLKFAQPGALSDKFGLLLGQVGFLMWHPCLPMRLGVWRIRERAVRILDGPGAVGAPRQRSARPCTPW